MAIKEFELFHEACLTRFVRRDKPMTFRLIEVEPSQSWSTYRVNDVNIFIKHSANPKELKSGGTSWTFQFNDNQIQQIKTGCHVVLVCGAKTIKQHMEICFIEYPMIDKLLAGSAKSVTVSLLDGQGFRVKSAAIGEKEIIARNAIDSFEIPA